MAMDGKFLGLYDLLMAGYVGWIVSGIYYFAAAAFVAGAGLCCLYAQSIRAHRRYLKAMQGA